MNKFPGVQLAKPYDDKRTLYPRIAEPKLDGIRLLIVPATGQAFTRTGKLRIDIPEIIQELAPFPEFVFDGELFGEDWNDTMSKGIKGKRFFAFDILPYDRYSQGLIADITFEKRSALLKQTVRQASGLIVPVPSMIVNSKQEALVFAEKAVRDGYEGAVLKRPDSFYRYNRNFDWVKLKFEQEDDVVILGASPGEGRLVGTLGAIEVVRADGVCFGVGTGLSDVQRRELWALHLKNELIGKVVEVKYEVAPKIPVRFPRLKRIRFDKDPKDVLGTLASKEGDE